MTDNKSCGSIVAPHMIIAGVGTVVAKMNGFNLFKWLRLFFLIVDYEILSVYMFIESNSHTPFVILFYLSDLLETPTATR